MTKTLILNPVLKKSLLFIIFAALSVTLPVAVHLAGFSGSVFMPIYFAVILAALFVDPLTALAVGILTPLLNHLATGMPALSPVPMLQMLLLELVILSLTVSLMRKFRFPALAGIISGVILARLSSILFAAVTSAVTVQGWIHTRLESIPGIILNILLSLAVYLMITRWKK